MADGDNLHEQLTSLHSISVEIAGLHDLGEIHDRALGYCLELTDSEFAFTGLLRNTDVGAVATGEIQVSDQVMDVAAIRGFDPDPDFYRMFHQMAVRASVVGVTIRENRSHVANDVPKDPHSVGQPYGHPPVRRFLGVPLRVGGTVIGMIGVANKPVGYGPGDEQLLATFAGQVAVAVDNARLYQRQRSMIAELQQLHKRLTEAEHAQLLGRERERIAGALHDRIEQDIFTIGVRLGALLEGPFVAARIVPELQELRQLTIAAADEVRRSIFSLTDPEHEGNLTDDLRRLLRNFERRSNIQVHLAVSGKPTPAAEAAHDVVHMVVSEALVNVAKHAQATVVLVSLGYLTDALDIAIQDDGVGAPQILFDTFQDSYLHFGLRHVRQVIIDRGGAFAVSNGDDAGLVVRASIPLPSRQP